MVISANATFTTTNGGDTGDPSAVADLAVVAGSQRGNYTSLDWTAPGDDGTTGTATSYDIRYSMLPIDLASDSEVNGTGTVTNDGTDTLILEDTSQAWIVDDWANGLVVITGGTGAGQVGVVVSNTATTLMLLSDWVTPLFTDSTYQVHHGTHTHFDDTDCVDATRPVDCVVEASGEPLPQVSGTLEQFTVAGLIPNTIYFFALKTTDEVGNVSLISTAPAGGDNLTDGSLGGRTAIAAGSNLVSAPLAASDTPLNVFGDDVATLSLSRWSSIGAGSLDGCYEASPVTDSDCAPQVEITLVAPGEGYYLTDASNSAVIDLPGAANPLTSLNCGLADSYSIPLVLGWNMIASPFATNLTDTIPAYIYLGGTTIRQTDSGAVVTCQIFDDNDGIATNDAVSLGWVTDTLYGDGFSSGNSTINSSPPAFLAPWKAYWLYVCDDPDGAGSMTCGDVVTGNTYDLILQRSP